MKKNYTISIPVVKFWTIVVPSAILLMIAGGLVMMLIVDRAIMPKIVRVDKGLVVMPDLHNLPWKEARQELYDVGLRGQVVGRQYDTEIKDNYVISQSPKAGENVNTAERRGVDITLSKGPEILEIPEIAKIMERKAKRRLREAGFTIGTVTRYYSNRIPQDHVISISPDPGTKISRELPVDISISKGPMPTHAEVPNIIGDLLSSAKEKIREAGLKVGEVEAKQSATSRPGTIISQSAAPGSTVPFEKTINLVVSTKK
ncbi:MAG: PASTA domain-containing protein [Chitinivibrionales bacterium]|nr:PASTA domain-containing protein [Chitinivibrionales bacterium]